jgi:acetolactate synthase I/II/III large subunit
MIRGADIVVKSLIAENAEYIFGYPGGAIMPVYDALYDYSDQIKHVLTRHEQGCHPRCPRLCKGFR